MSKRSWWRRWLKLFEPCVRGQAQPRQVRGRSRRLRCQPWLEILEDRLTPATVQLGLASEMLLESAGTFTIPVTISSASGSPTSVPFTLGGTAVSGTDYSGVTASPVVIPAGQTAVNITGTLLDDGSPDATKTLTFTLGTPSGANTLGSPSVNTLTITEPTANPTELSIANSSAIEPGPSGTTNMVFTVTRTGDLTSQITVGFTTVSGTAQPSTDFTPTTGTTTFAFGSATATISIPIFGNGVVNNPSLTFSVQLTGIVSELGPPVTLATHTDFTTGTFPLSVAVGDLNGDGKPDLVVANQASNSVSVFLNTTAPGATTPTFAAKQDFSTGSGAYSVAIGDLNGDGKPDLAVANVTSNSVSVLLNTTPPGATTLSFAAHVDFTTGPSPRSVAIGDFNGDGKPDLAVVNTNASNVSVLLNATAPGATTPSFAAKQDFTTGTSPLSVAVGDLNGDGKPDLVVVNFDFNSVSVLLNTTAPGATTLTFATKVDFATSNGPRFVAIGDLNGDGKPDLAVAENTGHVSVLLNTTAPGATTPTFATIVDFPTGANSGSVAIADLNGDGKPDLVVADLGSNTVAVLRNTTAPGAATPSFAANQAFATGTIPDSVAIADFNGDGQPDLAVVNRSAPSVSVLLNTTVLGAATITPAFPEAATPATGSNPFSVAMRDLNGDGKPDIVVTNYGANTVSVLLNTTTPGAATPTFATQQAFATGSMPISVALADVNGDGMPDIFVANFGSNTVSVLLNTTTPGATVPSFATQQTFATGSRPLSVAFADVNGDGKPDLVIANSMSDTVSVLLNTTTPGATTPSFAAQQTFATGSEPYSVAVGDVNGDGMPDIVTANHNGNTMSVLLNTTAPGATVPSFAAQQTIGTVGPSGSTFVALRDFNGDGKPDLVQIFSSSNASVRLNTTPTGATTASFTSPQTFASGPGFVAAADVNGDGKPDLLVDIFVAGVSVLLNATTPGATAASFAAQQTFAAGSRPYSLAVGDINGDGRPDILLANFRGNTVSVLLNTPVTILGDTATGTITESDTQSNPTVQFSAASESVSETARTFSITVTLSAASASSVSVPFTLGGTAVSGTDFSGVTASPLVIGAGSTSGTITGTLIDDNLFDTADRTLTVTLGTPTNATLGSPSTNTLTISEDGDAAPTVQFSAASESVSETAGTFSITVTLSAASEVATTIPFTLGGTAVSGTDYSGVTATPLIIGAGSTSGTITGTVLDDNVFDTANRTLTVTLGTPTNATLGSPSTNTLTINEDEDTAPTVQFSAASESVNETAGTFSITVTLSAASEVATTIPFTLGGTAVSGTDYSGVTASPLVIAAGQTSGAITGNLIDDGSPDATKTVTFTLGTPTNATLGTTNNNTLTITEAETPTVPATVFTNFASKVQLLSSNVTATGQTTLLPDTLYVNGLYHQLLLRAPDQAGVNGWVFLLQAGVSRAQVAAAIWQSAEHRGVQVDSFYQTFFHRASDAAGRAFWVNAFLTGASAVDVARGMLLTAEYQNAHSADTAFVTGLYTDVLGRNPDTAGLNVWVASLGTGTARAAVAQTFLTSAEYQGRVVKQYYVSILGRTPSAAEVQGWVNLLQSGSATLESVGEAILASSEYFTNPM